MDKDGLLAALQAGSPLLKKIVATEKGDWVVKGFINADHTNKSIQLELI